jgi:hypothetical protein
MGVKNFRTVNADILDFTKLPSFVAPRYFCSSPPLYFSAFHDRLVFTEVPLFPRLRQDSLFLPRRLLSNSTR